ncbi:MAG: tetratricopeptide repeat protein, partial [Acidobacteriaceae bacterium]
MSADQRLFDNAMSQGHSAAWDEEWEKAASHYRTAVNEFPDNLTALTSLALALFQLQKYQESLEYYQRASRLSPADPMPFQKIVEIYERTGDQANAARAYMNVAEVYTRNKDVEKSINSWRRVVDLDPENLAAHTRLALVYERLGHDSDAMTELIAIASLLQNQGNVRKAIQTIKHALQVVPNSKEASLALSI